MRILRYLIPIFLILTIFLIGFKEYEKIKASDFQILNVVPENASVIFGFNDKQDFYNQLNSTPIWIELTRTSMFKKINFDLKKISNQLNSNQKIFGNKFVISIHRSGANKISPLISVEINVSEIENYLTQLKKSKYDNINLYEVIETNDVLYFSIAENILFASRDKIIVEDAIRQFNSESSYLDNTSFSRVNKTIGNSNNFALYNMEEIIDQLSLNLKSAINTKKIIKKFGGWTGSDIKIKDDLISTYGFGATSESFEYATDIIFDQKSISSEIFNYIPESVFFIAAIGFDNAIEIEKNKNLFSEKNNMYWQYQKDKNEFEKKYDLSFDEIRNLYSNEIGFFNVSINNENELFTYIKFKNSITASSILQDIFIDSLSTKHNNRKINVIENGEFLNFSTFNLSFSNRKLYCMFLDDYLMLSYSLKSLQFISDQYISGLTVDKKSSFQKFYNKQKNKSNLSLFVSANEIAKTINKNFKNPILEMDSLEKIRWISMNISSYNNNLLSSDINIFYDQNSKDNKKEIWNFQLDTTNGNNINIVYNFFTKEYDILVQDSENIIYLIDNNGNLKWKKSIEEKIIGKISYLDYYKNNKYQFLFNTSSKLFLVDRLGRNVEDYPFKIEGETNLQHSLFDYDNSKDYRIIIANKKGKILNYKKNGNRVTGWKHTDNKIVNYPLEHFKVNEKDFIIKLDKNNKIELFARNGSSRTKFKEKVRNYKIDNNSKIYSLNNNYFWKGDNFGNENKFVTELPDSTNNFLVISRDKENYINNYIVSSSNNLYLLDSDFNISATNFELEYFIDELSLVRIKDESLIVCKGDNQFDIFNNKLERQTQISIDYNDFLTVFDIDNNNKLNYFTNSNNFIFNNEILLD